MNITPYILLVAVLMFRSEAGWSQIVLPDFMNPDTDPDRIEEEAPQPEISGHDTPDGEEETKDSGPGMERLLNRMKSKNTNLEVVSREETLRQEAMKEVQNLYVGGPERVRLRVEMAGERLAGADVMNQTFGVSTDLGVFPVRLHHLAVIEALEDGNRFRFEFRSGDKLVGRPTLEMLEAYLPDGRMEVVRLKDLVRMEISSED